MRTHRRSVGKRKLGFRLLFSSQECVGGRLEHEGWYENSQVASLGMWLPTWRRVLAMMTSCRGQLQSNIKLDIHYFLSR